MLPHSRLIFCLCLTILPLASTPNASADDKKSNDKKTDVLFRCELNSGQVWVAKIDARTDGRRIWLRFQNGATQLLRPVAWSDVASISRVKETKDVSKKADSQISTAITFAQRAQRALFDPVVPQSTAVTSIAK